MDQNEENFADPFFFICDKTTSITQRHAVNMAPENWKLRECCAPLRLWEFGRRSGPRLEKLEELFSRRITIQKIWIINETLEQVVLQYLLLLKVKIS